MRVILKVELIVDSSPDVSSGSEIEDEDRSVDSGDVYVELQTVVDLPFAPFIGLHLCLPVITTGHPNADRFEQALNGPALVPGIFSIDKVLYQVDEQVFRATATEYFQTSDELYNAEEQLSLGYGFMRV